MTDSAAIEPGAFYLDREPQVKHMGGRSFRKAGKLSGDAQCNAHPSELHCFKLAWSPYGSLVSQHRCMPLYILETRAANNACARRVFPCTRPPRCSTAWIGLLGCLGAGRPGGSILIILQQSSRERPRCCLFMPSAFALPVCVLR